MAEITFASLARGRGPGYIEYRTRVTAKGLEADRYYFYVFEGDPKGEKQSRPVKGSEATEELPVVASWRVPPDEIPSAYKFTLYSTEQADADRADWRQEGDPVEKV